MADWITTILLGLAFITVGYGLGSIATGILASRLLGLPDPRQSGSGNPGATNVLRSGNKLAALLTLLGDLVKGFAPVALAHALAGEPWIVATTGLAAFLGHLYPVWFGFRGGKGVATALGILLGLVAWVGLAALATWLAVAVATRISSLAALVTAVLTPLYLGLATAWTPAYLGIGLAMTALIVWRHRGNIENLRQGRETRIGAR